MYVSLVLDIPTRALDKPYSYVVPPELEDQVGVGCTVLASFGRRDVVAYVVDACTEPPQGVDESKLKPVLGVLAPAAFDRTAAQLALWMAQEYAAPLVDCVRLLLPPGQGTRMQRSQEGGAWELVVEQAKPVDERWAALTEQGRAYEPPRNALRQRQVLEALGAGSLRLAELSVLVPGARTAVNALAKRGAVTVFAHRHVRGTDAATTLSSAQAARPAQLTRGQRLALSEIRGAVAAGAGDVVLVDGVTGSGKTEVYLSAIEEVLSAGRGAIVLVPEISLTAQTVGRFRSRFGDRVAVLHSRLSTGERFDQWDLVRQGIARVVVGARSALYAPLPDPGLIIIDEEHEGSYKQDSSPRYHAREVAAELARRRGAALVLGSATPSLESLGRVRAGSWRGVSWTRVEMPERPGGAVLPQVEVVDLTREFASGNRSVFSRALRDALLDVAQRKEKAVLLLNRRGFAPFLMCRDCGCVPTCPHCSTALTYHERGHLLVCHSCDRSWSVLAYPHPASACPACGSRYLAQVGIGTQRVEDELALLLGPDVDVIRMDADSTRRKGEHQRLLEQFDASPCAVLVGTQMIAKGLDFPEVTLVGVVNADTSLKLPDFRAAERTYDLLEQVAGRAGRGERPGRVIVQTYWASHPAIRAVATHDRATFLDAELADRHEAGYPPFTRLGNVIFTGADEGAVRRASLELALALSDASEELEVLGPSDCVRAKVKDRHRRHVLVKAPHDYALGPTLAGAVAGLGRLSGVSVAVDVDAYDMM